MEQLNKKKKKKEIKKTENFKKTTLHTLMYTPCWKTEDN